MNHTTISQSIVINDGCLRAMALLPSCSIDLVVTDPPYGYSFMGKDWDKAVPSVDVWKETIRVLKAGAFAFVMCAPRQDVLSKMIVNMTEAGFDTDFTSIYWTYSSGFPKAHNVGKILDKRERKFDVEKFAVFSKEKPEVNVVDGSGFKVIDYTKGVAVTDKESGTGGISRGASGVKQVPAWIPVYETDSEFQGAYGGFQPKPAVEVIIVAMKPMDEKTFASQALKNGKGITWLDDCRIPYASESDVVKDFSATDMTKAMHGIPNDETIRETFEWKASQQGRFPANLLVSDDVLNHEATRKQATDKGSYSRYFDLDAWANQFPFLIVPKASKKEKDKGCEHMPMSRPDTRTSSGMGSFEEKGVLPGHNNHPTVKPLKLMSYLITLGSREGDVILDPFAGSGTTLVAAKQLNRKSIGIEMSEEYCEIIKARLTI